MHPTFSPPGATPTVPVTFVTASTWPQLRGGLGAHATAFAEAAGFEPRAGQHLLLPGAEGHLAGVLLGAR